MRRRCGAGRLNTRLAADAADVKGGTGEALSLVFQAGAAIAAGLIISFVACWQLALVLTGILPFMIVAALMQVRRRMRFATVAVAWLPACLLDSFTLLSALTAGQGVQGLLDRRRQGTGGGRPHRHRGDQRHPHRVRVQPAVPDARVLLEGAGGAPVCRRQEGTGSGRWAGLLAGEPMVVKLACSIRWLRRAA